MCTSLTHTRRLCAGKGSVSLP